MNKLAYITVLLALSSTSSFAGDAPQQTVENAQRFLEVISKQHALLAEIRHIPSPGGFYRAGIVTKIDGLECFSGIHMPEADGPKGTVVDWSKVAGIMRDENSSVVQIGVEARLHLPTVELATRVQYAMEFLRSACDATNDTGF